MGCTGAVGERTQATYGLMVTADISYDGFLSTSMSCRCTGSQEALNIINTQPYAKIVASSTGTVKVRAVNKG